jgi:hypothetical protein
MFGKNGFGSGELVIYVSLILNEEIDKCEELRVSLLSKF